MDYFVMWTDGYDWYETETGSHDVAYAKMLSLMEKGHTAYISKHR